MYLLRDNVAANLLLQSIIARLNKRWSVKYIRRNKIILINYINKNTIIQR